MSAIGVGVASKLAGSTPYVNTSLETATLYKYVCLLVAMTTTVFNASVALRSLNETFMTFQAMLTRPPSHSDLMTSPTPSVLDTHNRVCVWLPAGYWGNQTNRSSSSYQKSVLDIGQVSKPWHYYVLNFNPFLTGFSAAKGLSKMGPRHCADSALRDTSIYQSLYRLAKHEL